MDDDTKVVDVSAIAVDQRPTSPLNKLVISIDLDDPEAVAEFLEAVAKSIREKRRIIMIIE